MLPKAYIVHQLRYRVRIRVPEMRLENDFFDQCEQLISELEEVSQVEVSNITGSIMISHPEVSFHTLESRLMPLEIFELIPEPPPVTPAREIISSGVSHIDQFISERSSGGVDLGTIAFTAILGTALHQMLRGNFSGPAIPMLLSGLDLLRKVTTPDKTDPDPEK